jgi:hypothetical protein
MKIWSAAVLFLLTLGPPAKAGFFDGNKLFEDCKSSKIFVLGYVSGAFDGAEIGQQAVFSIYMRALAEIKTPIDALNKSYEANLEAVGAYCAPKGVILMQMTDLFCQYLSTNPAERHRPGNELLINALNKAWPCK